MRLHGERAAGLAALGVALACITGCGRNGAAWTEDGRRVVFGYRVDEDRAGVAEYELESGAVRARWSTADHEYLRVVHATSGGAALVLATVEKEPDRCDVLALDGAGEARAVRRFDGDGAAFASSMPVIARDGALWLVGVESGGEFAAASCRLDLATGEGTWPFGQRRVLLATGPAGDFYLEQFADPRRIELGRADLGAGALERTAALEAEALGLRTIQLASFAGLVVGEARLALVVGEREGSSDAAEAFTLLVLDLAGELLLRRELPEDLGVALQLLFEPGDRALLWTAVAEERLALRRLVLPEGVLETVELEVSRITPLELRLDELAFTAELALSPSGRHLALTLDSPPRSDVPDLLLFDLERGLDAPRAVRVPR